MPRGSWTKEKRGSRNMFCIRNSTFLASEIICEDEAQHASRRRTQVIDQLRRRGRWVLDDDSKHQHSLLRLDQNTVDAAIRTPPACIYVSEGIRFCPEKPKIINRELHRKHEPGKLQYQYKSLVVQITSLVHTSDFSPSPREHPWPQTSSHPAAHPSSRLRRVSPSKTSTSFC
jgi:hypothetical protein